MKTILVLPGSHWQEPLAEKIKDMGYRIALVSPEKKPPCKKYADTFLCSDIFNIDGILNFCTTQEIDAVISDECDIAMPVIAEIGEKLGVHTMSRAVAELYTDKFLMREFCKNHGLKYPEYKLCKSVEEALEFYNELGKDIIIKPLDSNASHGVFTIKCAEELTDHFAESLSYSRTKKAVLAERYISGTEFTIDGIKTPYQHYTLAVSQKKHFSYNKNIAYELFFTHTNAVFDYQRLKEINDIFVMKSELEYGLTHAEYKYENGDFYLIEIAARGGGNEISSLITPFMTGHDTYEYLVECALGDSRETDFFIKPDFMNRAAVLHFFNTPKSYGRVRAIHGEDFLKNNPAILDYALNFKAGDIIREAVNDSVRIGFYIAGEENEEALRILMKEIDQKFCIELE